MLIICDPKHILIEWFCHILQATKLCVANFVKFAWTLCNPPEIYPLNIPEEMRMDEKSTATLGASACKFSKVSIY